jgi:hypothetical protein
VCYNNTDLSRVSLCSFNKQNFLTRLYIILISISLNPLSASPQNYAQEVVRILRPFNLLLRVVRRHLNIFRL